ncbi:hypothetical protein KUTeg_015218 [Tegillarca granosa]|uniref:Leucine zipper transcription factor-like protein 1 n=1 Tax=Tegillarca granosa TaxID=220873 RepID=A0ABQ9EPJ0_TEGGR|nr:hypothetical protein KUTeg_015218 [Tegillarca granosa]
MTTELGVNEHHQAQVVNYMRFNRYQRGKRIKAVDMCFEELKDSRLDETTYTIDEVTDMLDGLLSLVRSEVESELSNMAWTNILLLRQMFIQAEKWHLKLGADISELENRDLLEQIAEFEDKEFAGKKRDTDFKDVLKNMKLVPLNETGGTALLHMAAALKKIPELSQSNTDDLEAMDQMRRRMMSLETDLEQSRKSGKSASEFIEKDLASTKHELLRIREMLEMAEKELEKKVSQTTPFKNLKQMLMKKNDQMKDLRKRLSKFVFISL